MRRPMWGGVRAARLRNARRDDAGTRSLSSNRCVLMSLRVRSRARALPREMARAVVRRRPSSRRIARRRPVRDG
eukprot:6406327-Alexandrium_andersonii.AAC.1